LKQRITAQEDEEAFQRLRREHDDLLTTVIARDNAGQVIKSTGDGVLAVFAEPSTAVERAIEVQQRLRGHPHISVRIGMDMGQVRVEAAGGVQRDMFGRHVDWAARAESMADAGHILVTRSVYTDAFGWIPKARVAWKEHGFHIVKENEGPLEVFEPYRPDVTEPMDQLNSQRRVLSPRLVPAYHNAANAGFAAGTYIGAFAFGGIPREKSDRLAGDVKESLAELGVDVPIPPIPVRRRGVADISDAVGEIRTFRQHVALALGRTTDAGASTIFDLSSSFVTFSMTGTDEAAVLTIHQTARQLGLPSHESAQFIAHLRERGGNREFVGDFITWLHSKIDQLTTNSHASDSSTSA
jgi:hypothetical protein